MHAFVLFAAVIASAVVISSAADKPKRCTFKQSPCQNGAACYLQKVSTNGKPTKNCKILGTCMDYRCKCRRGYSGIHCEHKQGATELCQGFHHQGWRGRCENGMPCGRTNFCDFSTNPRCRYACLCSDGTSGRFCENKADTAPLPKVCDLPKDIGPGFLSFRRWYFNKATGRCQLFTYGGAGGNGNNFEFRKDCLNTCASLSEVCDLPKKAGRCIAAFRRWFFNKVTGKCEKFIYGGCGGNGNNFQRKKDCFKTCEFYTRWADGKTGLH